MFGLQMRLLLLRKVFINQVFKLLGLHDLICKLNINLLDQYFNLSSHAKLWFILFINFVFEALTILILFVFISYIVIYSFWLDFLIEKLYTIKKNHLLIEKTKEK